MKTLSNCKFAVSTLALALVACSSLASADVVDIQFQGERSDGAAPLYTGQGDLTTPETTPTWNGLSLPNDVDENGQGTGGGTYTDLLNSSGKPTSEGIIVPDTYSQYLSSGDGHTSNSLLASYLFISEIPGVLTDPTAATDTATFTLTGMGTGEYNLYLYGTNANGGNGGTFTVNGGTPESTDGADTTGFNQGEQYVLFKDVSPVADDITITLSFVPNPEAPSGDYGEADFNGLQVQSVPEPSTVAMSLVGLVALGLLARYHGARKA